LRCVERGLIKYKDIYTEENLRKMELNERQIKAVMYVKEKGKITNKEYQEISIVTKKTASRDLAELVSIGLFKKQGTTGKGTFYVLDRHKGDRGDIKGTSKRGAIPNEAKSTNYKQF